MRHKKQTTATTSAAQAGQSETSSNGNSLLLALVLLSVLLSGYSFYRTLFPNTPAALTVVDTDRLAAAYIQEALANTKNGQSHNTVLAENIHNKLEELAASGRIIVRKSAVLTYPTAVDMTEQLAQELGIRLPLEQVDTLQPTRHNNTLIPLQQNTSLPPSHRRLSSDLD